jgi:hypothetical protein
VPRLQRRITVAAHRIVGIVLRDAQGLYTDGWITTRSHFAFPVPGDRDVVLKIALPSWTPIAHQEIRVFAGRTLLESHRFDAGEHTLRIRVPPELAERTLHITLRARNAFQPSAIARENPDRRRLCAIVRSFELEPREASTIERALPARPRGE